MISKIYRKYSQVGLVVAAACEGIAHAQRKGFERSLQSMDEANFGGSGSEGLRTGVTEFINAFNLAQEQEGHVFRLTQQINTKFYSDWRRVGWIHANINMVKYLRDGGIEDIADAGWEDNKVVQEEYLH